MHYLCGAVGPSGRIIYYASKAPFACGANLGVMSHSVKAAPTGWNGEEVKCPSGCGTTYQKASDIGAAGAGAGTGSAYCSGMGENEPIPNVGNAARAFIGGA